MLCSSCSRTVLPVVAVDIDGTLGDYHGHFLAFLQRYIGRVGTFPPYGGDVPFKQWAVETFGISEDDWHDVKLAYRQGAQKRSMPVFDWAQPLTGIARWEGAEVWVTTTRPYLRLDNIDPDTRAWLDVNGFEYDKLIYDKYKYQRLAEQVDPERVIAALDDLPEKAEEAAAHFSPAVPILKVGAYNSGVLPNYFSCRSLREATIEIVQRIHRWKELHS